MTDKPKPEVTLYFRKVPRSLRDAFKALCASEGVSMQEKALELLRTATISYTWKDRRKK